MSGFHNPVCIHFGRGTLKKLPDVLKGRRCILITSSGMARRGIVDRLRNLCGNSLIAVYAEVASTPTIFSTVAAGRDLSSLPAEVILAVGGGSVLDTAKAVAAQRHHGLSAGWLSAHLREGATIPTPFAPTPVVAVPTTAGTGSEVIMWATIWDEESKQKYSLSHPTLYSETALVDAELTVTLPHDITVATGLDALSHAMEAVWNRNANRVSDVLATRAISGVTGHLKQVLVSPVNVSLREAMHHASMTAGLAFSNTRTAIAHSISYPLTGQLGMPHGIACSFTLPAILKTNGYFRENRLDPILHGLGCGSIADSVSFLQRLLADLSVPQYVRRYLKDRGAVDSFSGNFITPDRAENNIVPMGQPDAVRIFRAAATQMLEG